jgi:WD40 repeat protein
VTGTLDKTVRIWSLAQGQLLQTIRVPAGPGNIGKIYAVAMRPEGDLVAAGGWTLDNVIYLFDRATGAMTTRLTGLPNAVFRLVFSPDGRYLAATLRGAEGVRIYDREIGWRETFRDGYGASTYGAAFANDGRLATASLDGTVSLYDRNFRFDR